MMSDVIEGVIEVTFHLIVETVLFYTGEIVLYVLSGGRKKPRWDYYSDKPITKWMILTEISVWVGFTFWLVTIGLIVYTFQ